MVGRKVQLDWRPANREGCRVFIDESTLSVSASPEERLKFCVKYGEDLIRGILDLEDADKTSLNPPPARTLGFVFDRFRASEHFRELKAQYQRQMEMIMSVWTAVLGRNFEVDDIDQNAVARVQRARLSGKKEVGGSLVDLLVPASSPDRFHEEGSTRIMGAHTSCIRLGSTEQSRKGVHLRNRPVRPIATAEARLPAAAFR
jgi:hypothetical protein